MHRVQSSLNRCIQHYFISTPMDFTLSHLQLAEAFSAIEDPCATLGAAPVVALNTRITLEDELSGEITDFTLVDSKRGKPGKGQLPYLSPLGNHLLGCSVGERVTVTLFGSRLQVRILAITQS